MTKIQLTYTFDDEDSLRAHLGGTERAEAAPVVAPTAETAPVVAPTAETAPATVEEERTETPDVDADGMPYDEDVHSSPPAFTADNRWRAKRGKADEAKKARADFLAAGGDVEPPAENELPGLPGAEAQSERAEPVMYNQLVEKISGMMKRSVIDQETVMAMYATHGGSVETAASVLSTNETARAAMFAELCEIEPEL